MPVASMTRVDTPQSHCRFALAWADITPPAGIYHRMWGAASHERAEGVHRPLRATVALFERLAGDGALPERRQFLVALDHCVLGAAEHEALVEHLATGSGQPKECILVVFSHTHAAGLMGLERASCPGGDLIAGYLLSMAECCVKLIRECVDRSESAEIVYGTGRCDLAANRDFFDGERGRWVCGFNPGVPSEDTVVVARVTNVHGATLATLVNYACHPTTLAWANTLISPDYVGSMRERVEQDTGAPCLFLQGASGELGPREGFVGDPAVADRNGRQLAFAALSALEALPAPGTFFEYAGPVVSGATLGEWKHREMDSREREKLAEWRVKRWNEPLEYRAGLPRREALQRELDELLADESRVESSGDGVKARELRAMVERKRRLLHRFAQLPQGQHYPLRVVVWQVGTAYWVGVQGESYSILQRELRRRFPSRCVVVASLAADWGASYLPPAELYDQGLYQESIAVVAPGSLEQLIESIAASMGSMESGTFK